MQIKRFFIRLFFGISALLFTLYLAILAAFPACFNINSLKSQIETEFSRQTGLQLGIESISLKPSFSPYINIYAHHAGILYPDKKELLKIKDINFKIRVFPILMKKIHIEKIILQRPIVSFSIDKRGKCSLDTYLQTNFMPSSKIAGFLVEQNIPDIEIHRYKIKAYDKMYSQPFIIEGEKLNVSEVIFTDGVKITTKGTVSHNDERYIKYDTDIETSIPEIQNQLFASNPFRYIKQYQIKANVLSKIKFKKTDNKIKPMGIAEIDKLSFRVNEKVISNNHIDFKIDDNKIKINADLKTDETNRLLVFGNYESGKNKNINLTVNAQDANLQTIKETAETILNALNIKNNLADYRVKGNINLNFKVKSDFKTLKSEGIAEISDAKITGKSTFYNISGINSKINFSNNKIKIEPSEMFVNNTPINLSGIIDSKTNLDILIKSDNLEAEKIEELFLPKEIQQKGVIKGKLSFKGKITGTAKSPNASFEADFSDCTINSSNKSIVKFKSCKLYHNGTLDKPKGKITINKINILPDELSNKMKAETIDIVFTPEEINIPKTMITFGGTPLFVSAKVKQYLKDTEYDLNVDGKLSSQNIYDYLKKTGLLKNISARAKGNITINGKITGKGQNLNLKADFRADADNYISGIVIKELLQKPSVTTVDAIITGKDINIKDITINKDNQNGNLEKILSVSGKIKNVNNPSLERVRFIVPQAMTFSVSQLQNSEITIKSALILNGSIKKPEIKGNLDVKNVTIPEYNLKSKVNEIIFEENNIKMNIPKLEIGKSKFNISANINPALTGKLIVKNMEIYSDYIDLDEINDSFSKAQNNPVYPGIALPIKAAAGKANIKIFKTGGLQAENINCDIAVNNNILTMNNITGTAYKGTIKGKSEYNFLHTSTVSEIYGKNADIRPLIKALINKNNDMSGTVDYKVKISSIGTKRQQQQRTAKGYVEFTAAKGMMGPLGQFEHFLYAQNLISQSIIKMTTISVIKAVRPQNTGLYTIAKGNIEINKGNAYLKPLTVEGPNMSLYITGKINVLNDLADIKIYGRISQQVEKVLGDLTNPMPQTIMSSSSETSIGNLFYDEYNTKIPKSITEAIPKLNPETGLSSRLFTVDIQGAPESVKSVKSFKWIVGITNAPIPEASYIEQQIHPQNKPETYSNPGNNNSQSGQNIPKPEVKEQNNTKDDTIPDFMNSLPDDFN